MNQRNLILVVGTVIAFIGVAAYIMVEKRSFQYHPSESGTVNTVCTDEARQCPDGSYVGRTAPNCEFAACPNSPTLDGSISDSGIFGTVLLGPTCPLQRMPPDPKCADKPYQTTLVVLTEDRKTEVTSLTSNAAGEFHAVLPPGNYRITSPGSMPPTCTANVTVEAKKFTNVDVPCDTGIR
jgi:hypothetical protein